MASSSSSTTTSSSSSGNVALEECDVSMPCVPEFTKDTNTSVKKQCDTSLITDDKCYLELKAYDKIYDNINWDVLSKNIDINMKIFCESLMNDAKLCEKMYNVYGIGPFPLENDWPGKKKPSTFAFIEHKIIDNADFKKCQNIIVKILLNRGAVKTAKQKQFIAHISLHPKKPKYYRDTTRSRSGCGYICRKCKKSASNTESNTVSPDSPFHYVIDSINFSTDIFQDSDKFRPELPLTPPDLASSGGKFLEPKADTKFPELYLAGFWDNRKTNKDSQKLTPKLIDEANDIHLKIMTMFIDFWNKVILEQKSVISGTSGAGAGTSGGKRKTRRGRHHKNKTRKH